MNPTLKLTPIRFVLLFCLGLALGYLWERPVKTSVSKRMRRQQRRDQMVAQGDLQTERNAQ